MCLAQGHNAVTPVRLKPATPWSLVKHLTLYLIETPFDAFANRADPDQAALVRAA